MELDGEVRAGGVELLGPTAAHVLPQDAGGQLVPVVDGEDVTVGQVQAGKENLVRAAWEGSPGRTPRCWAWGSEVTSCLSTALQ